MIRNYSIGSDPEFSVRDIRTKKPIAVCGKLGGTKDNPLSIGRGCSRQEDNVGAEFCIPPSKTEEEFVEHINYCITKGNEILNEKGLEIYPASSLEYDNEQLTSREALEFGCTPAFDVYTTMQTRFDENPGNLRSFGFHIHIGWHGDKPIEELERLIKTMDCYLGVPSVIIDQNRDRRRIYGKAGEARFPSYGVEYRSLGGNLLKDERSIRWVFRQTRRAIRAFNNGFIPDENARNIINNQDEIEASRFCDIHGIPVPDFRIKEEVYV